MASEADIFKSGMRRLASGVSIVTTLGEAGPRGLTATAICSVSVDPPTLLCCINRGSSAHDVIHESRVLAVNFLGTADQELANRFSGIDTREARFAEGRWTRLATGAPILETALASFDCRILSVTDSATHSIFICEVIATRLGPADAAPLLYFDGDYGRLAAPETQPSRN